MYIQAIVPWNECNFKVKTIEYSGQWIAVFSFHVKMNFSCVVIGVYAGSLVGERSILWEEIITLETSFGVLLFILGDFNETLHHTWHYFVALGACRTTVKCS
jgi:hypothetical protein